MHKTVTVRVLVDVDEGIAPIVLALNEMPGVRTYASCEGRNDGQEPYRPYVMVSFADTGVLKELQRIYDVTEVNEAWCYVHPKLEAHPNG